MPERTIRVFSEREPDLYDELVSAMLTHGQHQGCCLEQYTETIENGLTIARLILRNSERSQPE